MTRRVVFTLRRLVAQLSLHPVGLADRLEGLFRMDAQSSALELERLVEEVAALVHDELPGVDVRLPFPPRTRQGPWRRQ